MDDAESRLNLYVNERQEQDQDIVMTRTGSCKNGWRTCRNLMCFQTQCFLFCLFLFNNQGVYFHPSSECFKRRTHRTRRSVFFVSDSSSCNKSNRFCHLTLDFKGLIFTATNKVVLTQFLPKLGRFMVMLKSISINFEVANVTVQEVLKAILTVQWFSCICSGYDVDNNRCFGNSKTKVMADVRF